jgi:hypothetical protein
VAETVEELDESFFARKLRPRLRIKIGAAELDPKRFWAALNFPRPYGRAAAGACHYEIFVWAKSRRHVGPRGLAVVEGPGRLNSPRLGGCRLKSYRTAALLPKEIGNADASNRGV